MRGKMNINAILDTFEGFRPIDGHTVLRQIGRMNHLAISGGRATLGYQGVILPAGKGYYVTVSLDASDTYTVRRLFKRGNKVWIKGEATSVYADRVGEVAYQASCYLDEFQAA